VRTEDLGNHVSILSGSAFKSSAFNRDGKGLPLIRIRDVKAGCSKTFYDGPYDDKFVIDNGDLLIGMDGEFNRANWNGGKALLNQRVCKLEVSSKHLDKQYLYHFLPPMLKRIEDDTPFVTVKHLSAKTLRQSKIPLPPLPEQKRIAAILDQADALRRQRHRALDRLDQLGQSIFYDMFGDPVENTKGFQIVKLSEAGSLDRGVSKHRPRNHPALLGGDHPLVQTGDVSNAGDYLRSYSKTYSETGLRQSKKWAAGTLCITIAANIANTAILDFDACFPDSVVGFVPNNDFSSLFIHYWFKSVREDIERLAPAVAQKNINLRILRDLDLIAPDRTQQETFSKRLQILERAKLETANALSSTETLFSSLQHCLFSGNIQC